MTSSQHACRSIWRVTLVSSLAVAGCGGANVDGGDADDGTTPCEGSETRCADNVYQACEGGFFVNQESCVNACVEDLGCLDCDPASATGCDGADVLECNPDGTFGDLVETCSAGEVCEPGGCTRSCTADGVDLIYVVDDSYNLRSFDPRLIDTAEDPFTLIGPLSCPASGTPAPGWVGNITPFSMAVDREAVAWVLYASGEIFQVSTSDATCTATGFQPSQQGMNLFGMGFVTDEIDGDTEKLFIGGGTAAATPGGQLGVIDEALEVSLRGPLRDDTEYSAELTGTGAAELFGFYPGINQAFVQEIDPPTGAAVGPEYSVPGGLGGGEGAIVQAWAFAQWAGSFYLFVTTNGGGGSNSTVRTIDRATGIAATAIQNLPYFIVGAGVSTCAPTDID